MHIEPGHLAASKIVFADVSAVGVWPITPGIC